MCRVDLSCVEGGNAVSTIWDKTLCHDSTTVYLPVRTVLRPIVLIPFYCYPLHVGGDGLYVVCAECKCGRSDLL